MQRALPSRRPPLGKALRQVGRRRNRQACGPRFACNRLPGQPLMPLLKSDDSVQFCRTRFLGRNNQRPNLRPTTENRFSRFEIELGGHASRPKTCEREIPPAAPTLATTGFDTHKPATRALIFDRYMVAPNGARLRSYAATSNERLFFCLKPEQRELAHGNSGSGKKPGSSS